MNTVKNLTLRTLLSPAVRSALEPRFSGPTASQILDEAFLEAARELGSLPQEDSLGGRLMLRLAALTAGFYHALRKRNLSEEAARNLTGQVTWQIYAKAASIPMGLAKLRVREPRRRLRLATDLYRKFPFGPPAYRMRDVETDADTVAFDVIRCPVAEYFRSRGLEKLCAETWCNLDFPLAEQWGATLERSMTLAGGADHCDFRWRVNHSSDLTP